MSDMVERVAKAMCAAEGDPWDELNEDASATGIQYILNRADWRRFARAAMATMREPTDAVALAVAGRDPIKRSEELVAISVGAQLWRDGIDAALGEHHVEHLGSSGQPEPPEVGQG